MAHKINPYIIADFETGGLESSKAAITQVALLCISGDTLQEVGRYDAYIKPYVADYDPKALEYTGITFEMLNAKGKELKVVKEEVAALIKKWREETGSTHTKKPILVGQNIMFDCGFFQQLAKETKQDLSQWFDGREDSYGNYQINYIDTQSLGKMTWGGDETMNKFQLGVMIQKAELELADAHSAMNDVIGTKELFIHFINKLRSSGNGIQGEKVRVRDHWQM